MKTFSVFAALVSLVIASHSEARAASEEIIVKPKAAERFATLPDGVRFPEGITANPKTEEIYVATFDFGPNSNKLLRFNKQGQLVAERDFGGTPLLGLRFNSWDKKIYIANVGALVGGASKIQRIAADFNDTTPIEDVVLIPSIGAPPNRVVGNPTGARTRSILATTLQRLTLLPLTVSVISTYRIRSRERSSGSVMRTNAMGLARRPRSNMMAFWRRLVSLPSVRTAWR